MAGVPKRAAKIVFVATEDWFFASHFLPMARAAVSMGLETVVVARVREHRAKIEATGARVVALDVERGRMDPLSLGRAIAGLARIMRAERPDLVHCIALRGILVGGAAARMTGVRRAVFALTGLGFLGARRDTVARAARLVVRIVLRGLLAPRDVRWLFENRDDPRLIGLSPDAPNVVYVGGAGVDPDALVPSEIAPPPPLRIATVARMLWSKGIDTAVEAVTRARDAGVDVTLSLYGAPDPSNPRAIPVDTLKAWGERPGIMWHGATDDVAAVWRTHHACCLPSRGGEGLPRTLLEAAACGRAILTTDVPGCRTFVRDGRDGFVVAPDDPAALADAIHALAADPARLDAMGRSARARVLDGHTVDDVSKNVVALYSSLLI